jgi:tetratricopeptide (TPR) repeat protein
MIPNTDFFDLIDDYCLEQLEDALKLGFESELKANPLLKSEMELWLEIQGAINEKEVLILRSKLKSMTQQQNAATVSGNESFELMDEFSEIQEITDMLSSEELINFYDSLPKVHAYHHVAASNENIHQFYKNQKESSNNRVHDVDDDLTDFDLAEFEGLEQAIMEKDILHFRQTLQQVAKSIEPQFSVEEIEEYLNGELTGTDLIEFENDMMQNRSLRGEVKLHQDIDSAINENDIMNLRGQISNILHTETSWNVSEKSIENYIDGTLEGELLDEFLLELKDNSDLMAEVELRKQVNESIGESDIFNLRNELKAARESAEVKKVKMLIPESKVSHVGFWRSSVAILIVLLGIAGVLRNSFISADRMYDRYFEAPAWSPERSLSNEITLMQRANVSYLKGDFAQVINILDQVPESNIEYPVFDFYKAASFQRLDQLEEAIAGYTKVINHGDNLFIEESEWYRSLCYLKTGNKQKAKTELFAVIERKGHFENDAKAVIRRLKFLKK